MNFVTYNVWKTSRTHTHTLLAGRPKLAKNALGTARSFKKSRCPPVSLPLVNNEVAFVHSNPPSRRQKVKLEVDAECTSDTPEPDKVSKSCYACGLTVELASAESCKEG